MIRSLRTLCFKTGKFKAGFILPAAIFVAAAFFSPNFAGAATITSTATGGNWATGGTWIGGVAPAGADTAIIATTGGNSVNVAANATIANFTVNAGSILYFPGSQTLTMGTASGVATVNGTVNGASGTIVMSKSPMVLAGTGTINSLINITQPTSLSASSNLTVNGIITLGNTFTIASGATLTATQISSNAKTVANNGTVNLGSYVRTGGTAIWTQGTNAVLNISGTFTPSANITLNASASGNTINYNGADQAIEPASTSYFNLTTSGSGTKTTAAATTIGGNLNVGFGTTFATGITNTWTLSVTGTTTVGGTLTLNNTGNKTFTNNVTINSGGVWNETGIAAITFNADLTNNAATFTANTGTHTFGGVTHILSGSTATAIPGTAVFTGSYANNGTFSASTLSTFSGATLTNNGTVTVSTALSGAGGFTQGNTGILNFEGASIAVTAFSASASGNTVNYTGAAQTVRAAAYSNLIFSNSGAKSIAAGTSVAGNLSIAPTGSATASIGAGLNISVGSLTTGGLGTINGTWGSTASAAANQDDTYFAATTGILTVTTDTRMAQATLIATSTPGTVIYGSTSTLSATGGSGTGIVTFSAGASTGCSVAGTVLSVTDASGTCTATAAKAGDKRYLPATSAPITVVLAKANQTIVFGALSDRTFGEPDFDVSATSSSGLVVSFSSLTPSVCTVTVATVHLASVGTCTIRASQAGNGNYIAATPVDQSFNSVQGGAASFALNDPGNMNTGARLGYTVTRNDQYGSPTSVSSTIVYLQSNSTSTTKAFYDAASGGNQIASIIIQAGSTSTQFWYYDTVPGTYTVTAYDNSSGPDGAIGINDATDSFSVVAGAVKFIFANVPSSATAGDTLTFNVYAADSFDTVDTSFNQDVTVTKTGSASGAPTGGGLVTIINGVGTSTVSDTLAETVNLALQDTQSTGLNVSSTASVAFSAGPVAKLGLNNPGNMNTGTRLAYTVSHKDQYDNPVSASSEVVYLYSSSTSTARAFYDAASGGNQIASTTIQAGSTSTQFWYYDTTAGTYTITVSDNPTAPDGAVGIADAADQTSVVAGAVKFIFANVPSSATAGDTLTFNVYAVDSFDVIDTSFNGGVTVTASGSGSAPGLITLVNGVATTTVTDAAAETVTIGLQDTQGTTLGVSDSKTITFSAVPVTPSVTGGTAAGGAVVGVPVKPNPWVDLTFSGYVYPGAAISLIRKDQGLLQGPVLQTASSKADGSFLLKVNHVIRLTGQTYVLVFADRNGQVSQTRAYNIPAGYEAFGDENTIIAPSVGFSGNSVVTKGKYITIQGYAAPKGTVRIFVDGNEAGSVLVNAVSGQYRYSLPTDDLEVGRHSIQARQTVGGVQSDGSSQQSFTVSSLANPRLDLNGDGIVSIKDMSIYLSYLKNLGAGIGNLNTIDKNLLRVLDLNGDGALNVQDLSILLAATR